jgi:hypothetical protein
LANLEPGTPKQASLRRAVSTAYYALFHLLIDEAVGNWNVPRQRSTLARTFEHSKMRNVCQDHVKDFYKAGSPTVGVQLKNVAEAFNILREQRHTADYDNAFDWLRTDAIAQVDLASGAFKNWRAIRTTDAAQDFLLTLFLSKLPRQ